MNKECVSVIVPCYNEEATIVELLNSVLKQEMIYEIIVIDDGSTDKSVELVKGIGSPKIKVELNSTNLGKGKTVNRGLNLAAGQFVIIQDADLEYDPNEYENLINPLIFNRADVVYGSRFLTSTSRRVLYYWHRLGNSVLTTLSNIATNIDLTDMETCYKAMRIQVARSLNIEENRFGIEPEMTAKFAAMKLRIFEIPISYNGRTYEEGKKITWKDGFSALRCIVKYNLPRARKNQLIKWLNQNEK
jgi:glycosyltransferase involved in cell wall biosynthesis